MIDNLIANIESYYKTYNVYRAFVICDNDEETLAIADGLRQHNHSVYTITYHDVECDDRSAYMKRLEMFDKQSVRMLIVTYEALKQIPMLIESYVLPEQNLVAFGNISDDDIDEIMNWLDDANSRGFMARHDCKLYHALIPIEEKYVNV